MSSEHASLAEPVLEANGLLSKTVIAVSGLSKSYRMYRKPSDRLWHGLFGGSHRHNEFWALNDVGFEIRKGETVGIIGRNGSGKSTLLQIIAGTLQPTSGVVDVRGKVAALLELGSGFNPEFTGRENVYLNAAILGLSRAQIEMRMESILEFADIGEFIDQPVRSYSSGMSVRLAFSVIAHVDADVLIVDEALSVGDAFFSQKCMRFLREFQKRGTLLFVSHDAAAVTNLCSRAIWLDAGRVRMMGAAQDVIEGYMAHQHAAVRNPLSRSEVKVTAADGKPKRQPEEDEDFRRGLHGYAVAENRLRVFNFDPDRSGVQFGAGQANVESVDLLDDSGNNVGLLAGGEIVRLRIRTRLLEELEGIIIGFYVKDRLGQRLFGDNTYVSSLGQVISGVAGDFLSAEFRFRMPVMPSGSYMVDAAIASGSQEDHTQQHWIHDALEFRAIDETMRHGLIGIPMFGISIAKEGRE